MRLINATTLQLEDFQDELLAPPYAILSHTWAENEVLFKDIQDGAAVYKTGYTKVQATCSEARRRGLQHVWIGKPSRYHMGLEHHRVSNSS